jgi:hypothetical protein
MTTKQNLVQLCCQRFREAKAEAAAISAKRLSELDDLVKMAYTPVEDDSQLGQLLKFANSAAAKANDQIVRIAEEFGIHPVYRPTLTIDHGQYFSDGPFYWWRTSRPMAESMIGTREREAAAQIEDRSIDTLIRLMDEDIAPAEAAALVQAIPAAVELMPEMTLADLDRESDHVRAEAARDSEVPW